MNNVPPPTFAHLLEGGLQGPESVFNLPAPPSLDASASPLAIALPPFPRQIVNKSIRAPTSETPVLSLGPASAVDVYVDLTNTVPVAQTSGAILVVRIYAINAGIRALVGMGRARNQTGAPIPRLCEQQRLVASARAAADKFEVTVSADFFANFTATGPEFPISAIGYQLQGRTSVAPVLRTCHAWSESAPAGFWKTEHSGTRIETINGVNTGAAACFIQVWDDITPGLTGGVWLDEIAVPAGQPWSLSYGEEFLEVAGHFVLINSTTGAGVPTLNAAAAGSMMYEVH